MNAKQKRADDLFCEFILATRGASLAEHAMWLRDCVRDLLADEPEKPEKELKDYTLAELAELVHDIAKEKGWWEGTREWAEISCLIHSEFSEAVECYRNGEMAMHIIDGKPEGMVVELADALIRCLDYLQYLGVAREQRGSLTAAEAVQRRGQLPVDIFFVLQRAHCTLARVGSIPDAVWACIAAILDIAKNFDLDLPAAIVAKIEYNATRPYRHGGKKA